MFLTTPHHTFIDPFPEALGWGFVQRFTDLIERGCGFVERDVTPEQNS